MALWTRRCSYDQIKSVTGLLLHSCDEASQHQTAKKYLCTQSSCSNKPPLLMGNVYCLSKALEAIRAFSYEINVIHNGHNMARQYLKLRGPQQGRSPDNAIFGRYSVVAIQLKIKISVCEFSINCGC